MAEIDEYNEACEVALRLANQGLTAEEITSELNGAFESAFFEAKGVVCMRREPDYLPSRTVVKIA